MPLDADILARAIKDKLDDLHKESVGEPNLKALAEAVVEHIQANAEVTVPGVMPGSSVATRRIG